MTKTWLELGVPKNIIAGLVSRGIESPFPVQEATLPDALAGNDICGKAPTGSGKTLAFGIAIAVKVTKSRPGRPTALGPPGDHVGFHGLGTASGCCGEGTDRIHGADHRLGHRQPSRPARVTGAEELVPRVGDEIILDPFLAVPVEDEGLIGDHLQFHHH